MINRTGRVVLCVNVHRYIAYVKLMRELDLHMYDLYIFIYIDLYLM